MSTGIGVGATTRRRLSGTSARTLVLALRSSAGSALVAYALNLVVIPFVLHRLGAPLYGAWATIASLLAIGALADAGVRTELVRRVAEAQGSGDAKALASAVHVGTSLLALFGAMLLGAGLLAAPLVTSFAFPGGAAGTSADELTLLVRCTVALLAATIVVNGYFGVLRGIQRSDVEMVARTVALPLGTAVLVGGLFAGWGLWALFAGSAAQAAFQFAMQAIQVRRLLPGLGYRWSLTDRAASLAFLSFSGMALLSQVSDVIDSQWDKLVLSRFVGASSVASFQVGTVLVLQAKALAILPLGPLLVVIAELRSADRTRMLRLYALLARATYAAIAVVLGGVVVFAPAFVGLWLGSQYSAAGDAARLFGVAMVINACGAPLAFRAFGEGLHRIAAVGSVTNIVVNGAVSFALTATIGFRGALYGSIAGNVLGLVIFLLLLRRHLRIAEAFPWRAALIGIAATFFAVLVGVDHISSWPVLISAAAAFAGAVGLACCTAEGIPVRSVLRR
jgi:O-antigen/teichoic acid export membrane protein